MEQSPSWEANQLTLQLVKKFPAFMEPESPSPYPQVPPPVPILSQLYPVPTTPSNFLKIHLNIILTIYVFVSLMASFPQPSPPTPCAHLYPPPYVPHALPISFVELCALAAIKAHVKKPFAEPLNVNVCSFLNILSSALVRTNRTGAADCHVSRRANSSSSPAP
jgi:hypothetical protein